MSEEEDAADAPEISYRQKKEIAKYVKVVIDDDEVYEEAASEAFPMFNKTHMICLEMPRRSGDVLVTSYGEISDAEYIDPRNTQVATVDHVKQVYTGVRDATIDEIPSAYVEEFRCAMDAEMLKYVEETYPKGFCSIYCINGKAVEEPGSDFELVAVISASRLSPQNFCGSWRSVWHIEFKDDIQVVEIKGKLPVRWGLITLKREMCSLMQKRNVGFDNHSDTQGWFIVVQSPEDSAVSVTNIIWQHEAEYLTALEASYTNLPDTTFKGLRRKLPVTRTLFPWHNTLQFSLTRDIYNELGITK